MLNSKANENLLEGLNEEQRIAHKHFPYNQASGQKNCAVMGTSTSCSKPQLVQLKSCLSSKAGVSLLYVLRINLESRTGRLSINP